MCACQKYNLLSVCASPLNPCLSRWEVDDDFAKPSKVTKLEAPSFVQKKFAFEHAISGSYSMLVCPRMRICVVRHLFNEGENHMNFKTFKKNILLIASRCHYAFDIWSILFGKRLVRLFYIGVKEKKWNCNFEHCKKMVLKNDWWCCIKEIWKKLRWID